MTHLLARFLRLAALCALVPALSAAPAAFAQTGPDWAHEASDLPADPAVRFGQLPNGFRYAILVNNTPPGTAAVRMAFNAGSLAEADDQRGLAHFLEHMAFNGTVNVPEGEMVPLLERYGLAFGPDTNAGTSMDYVVYMLNLPNAEEELLETALFLMRETASNILNEDDAIDRERGVILGEERFRNTPIRRYFSARMEFLYPGTLIPVRDPIGTVEVIQTATRERFVDYYRNYYTPQRGVLTVVGAVDPDDVEARIAAHFADWAQPEGARGDPDLGVFEHRAETRFGFFHDPEIFTLINIDVFAPGAPPPDTAATRRDNLLRQLGNGIVQRRLQALINAGDSPLSQASLSSGNSYDAVDQAGLFAVTTPDRWREGLAMAEQELRRALEHGFTRAELDEQLANVRTALRNAAARANTRENTGLANALWSSWANEQVFTHPSSNLARFEALEPEINVEAVEAAFREIWALSAPQVFLASPEAMADPGAEIAAAWTASRAVPVTAPEEGEDAEFAYTDFGPAGEVVSRTHVADMDFHQVVFANGVRLNIKQTEFEDDVIRVRAHFGAGDLTPQPSPAAGSIASSVFVEGGLEAHSADELQRLLAGRSVGGFFGVAEDSFILAGNTTPADFQLQMQLMAAYMTAPGWRDDGLRRFRAISAELRRSQNAQALQVVNARVSRMLRGGDPRWGFPTAEEVDAFTMDHARELIGPALASAPLEISIVGDIGVEDAIAAVAATFGALPPRAAEWPSHDENRTVTMPQGGGATEVVRFAGQDYQGMANVYWPTGGGEDVRRTRVWTMVNRVLRLKSIERFREQEGATYSAMISDTQSRVFTDFGFIWIGLDVTVDDVERMYGIVDEVAGSMAAGDVSEDEMLRARRPVLEQLRQSLDRNPYWLNVIARSQGRPDDLDRARSAIADFESITAEEVVALAAEYMTPERAWRVSILPAAAE